MHDAIPIPPNQGCIVFQTPRAPCRIRCPRPSSIRKRGTPSKMSITKKGMRKAPKMYTHKYRFSRTVTFIVQIFLTLNITMLLYIRGKALNEIEESLKDLF